MTLLCGASKGFMKVFTAFIKPFVARQRSVKIKIWLNLFSSSGIGILGVGMCFYHWQRSQVLLEELRLYVYRNGKWLSHSLHKKCPYSEFFWSAFFHILTEYGDFPELFSQNTGKFGPKKLRIGTLFTHPFYKMSKH